MKVLLIAVPIMDRRDNRIRPIAQDAKRYNPPYGIYLLSAVLKEAGHEVVLIDLIADGSRGLRPEIDDLRDCSLVGISSTTLSWPTAIDVIKQVRLVNEDVPIVLGGIHPTMFDRYLLAAFPIDFVIRGEGEAALPHLCRVLEQGGDLAEVPNLTWKTPDGTSRRNPEGPKLTSAQFAAQPLPDYDRLPANVYRSLSIESSRGCAFDCSFCSTSYRLSWRAIPAAQFVDRLEAVMAHTDKSRLGVISIIDDEFSTNPKRATEIACLIRSRGLTPRLCFDSRANDLLKDGVVENLAEFTHQFLVGAECGYDEGLKKIGKGVTCDSLENAARVLYEHDLSGHADFSFILGLPWEGREEVAQTVRFAAHLFASYGVRILLQWYCQIPGSRLWDDARRKGIVNETMYNDYGFFRNLHLFRSGVRLHPTEIWEIADKIGHLQRLSALAMPHHGMIESAFPIPIAEYFPREVVMDDSDKDSALINLRKVARPPIKVGIPERSM